MTSAPGQRYKDDLIYCTTCTEQPDFFYEVMAHVVNRVTQDSRYIGPKFSESSHYECPNCEGIAFEGWRLNQRRS